MTTVLSSALEELNMNLRHNGQMQYGIIQYMYVTYTHDISICQLSVLECFWLANDDSICAHIIHVFINTFIVSTHIRMSLTRTWILHTDCPARCTQVNKKSAKPTSWANNLERNLAKCAIASDNTTNCMQDECDKQSTKSKATREMHLIKSEIKESSRGMPATIYG